MGNIRVKPEATKHLSGAAWVAPDCHGMNFYQADPAFRWLARHYMAADLHAHLEPHLDRLGEQIGTAASAFLRQYAYLGVALPVLALWRRRDRLAVGLLLTTALYALYALTYDAIDAGIFFLPGLMLLNISLTFLPRRGQPILLILPITLLALNFGRVNLREDEMLRARAQAALIAAPPAGILLTPGDETIFTLWYFQTIEGLRPDLILIDANLYAFDWYRRHLSHQHPDLTHLERDDLPALWQQAEHPTCAINLTTAPPLTCENHAQR